MNTPSSGGKSGSAVQDPSPDFEVLPPERGGTGNRAPAGKEEAISRMIAYLMDNLVKVPGTKTRVGINPFLDLIPVLGDGAAMIVSALTLAEGARRRVPKVVLARMGLNILLNGAIGTIPGVGEAFAFWFKPSSRNYQLLMKHTPDPGQAPARLVTWREWAFVVGLIVAVLLVFGALIGVGFWISYRLFELLAHGVSTPP